VDPATSGKILLREREAGSVLCRSLKKGDHVVIAKLDRAFRRLSDCCVMLEDFERRGVHLHVCNLLGGAIDLSKPIGRFLIQMLGAFAELERAFIAERTSEAMKARRRHGLGGGRPHYGFKHETRHRTVDGKREAYKVEVPDPEERRVMRMILAWRTEDPPWSWDQIREKLNYGLKLRTRDGREWSIERIRRAAKAEAILQLREVTDGRCIEPSR
jgi:DNA invertase Pin-like site-specific DNA recombinase